MNQAMQAAEPKRQRMPESLSLVIPCFNEEAVLPELLRRIEQASEDWPRPLEIIWVDDGSIDQTAAILTELASEREGWRLLRLSRNFGHQAAVSAGLAEAKGEVVAIIDADLQDPPELISKLVERWSEGFEVVYAVRRNRKESAWKRGAYFLFYRLLQRIAEVKGIPLDSGDFCLLDRRVVKVLVSLPEKNRFLRGLRSWSGFRQTSLVYDRGERAAGESKYDLKRLFKLAGDGLIAFSGFPLRLASVVGSVLSLVAGFGAVIFALQRVFPGPFAALGLPVVPGFAAIIVTVLFLGGVQLLFLGIIGEYLNRIYTEVKNRPDFVVWERVGFDS